MSDEEEVAVVIVGAGPAGLATSACLTLNSIPHLLLEREDCSASLWKKYSYDRLHLNLSKSFSHLPHFPLPSSYPRFLSRDQFVSYLDAYVSHFDIVPTYNRRVELACFDEECGRKWMVRARNMKTGEVEEYRGRFLVAAIGEQTDPYVPEIEGLSSFPGDALHSTSYKNGKAYQGKRVLVVGCGSSGMDIALDLAEFGANTSIIVHRPIHILPREVASWGASIWALKFPVVMVDWIMVVLSYLFYGDMTKYGIFKPKEGPFALVAKGKRPVFDVGTYAKIKSGKVQVLQRRIARVRGNEVSFEDGRTHTFDAMVLCTGFKRPVKMWLKGDDTLFNEDGTAKLRSPNNWKGKNGLYAHGLSNKGLIGINKDAQKIANDINSLLS